MVLSNQVTPGMILSINGKLYRVDSCVKVTVAKGTPFIKTELRDITTNTTTEKNFKLNQTLTEVSLSERRLEFLYPEGKDYLFLDIGNLDQVLVPAQVIGNKTTYLKEGVELKASFYGSIIFSIELPPFLELMVAKMDTSKSEVVNGGSKWVILETGAKVAVPPFIAVGDIIKVDTKTDEYIQRV